MKIFLYAITLLLPLLTLAQKKEDIKIRNAKDSEHMSYIVDGEKVDKEVFFEILKNNEDLTNNLTILKEAPSALIGESSRTIALMITTKDSYSIQVFASGFDSFLATQPSKNYYTEELLKTKNALFSSEWNRRCENPILHEDIYTMPINYNPKEDYGLDIEYQLYMFFRFMEKEYNMSLSI